MIGFGVGELTTPKLSGTEIKLHKWGVSYKDDNKHRQVLLK